MYSLQTDDGYIEIYYHDGAVLATNIRDNGFEYLGSLLYSITNSITNPKLVLVPDVERNTRIIRDNGMRASRVVLDRKAELYYLGDLSLIRKLLYGYYLERDGLEPFNNIKFLQTVNSPHKTLNYKMDTVFAI